STRPARQVRRDGPSLHPLGGAGEWGRRDVKAGRLGGPEIDDKLELRRRLPRKVGGFFSLEYAIYIRRGPPPHLTDVDPVGRQTAVVRGVAVRIEHRHAQSRHSAED